MAENIVKEYELSAVTNEYSELIGFASPNGKKSYILDSRGTSHGAALNHAAAHAAMNIGAMQSRFGSTAIAACCGDSITANAFETVSTYSAYKNVNFYAQAAACAGVFPTLTPFALGGYTTALWIRDYLQPALISGAKVAFILLGINDIHVAGVATSVTKANLTTIYSAFINAGIYVVALSILPDATDATESGKVYEINQWIASYWATNGARGEYQNVNPVVANQAGTNTTYKTNYDIGDGIHPSNLGVHAIGAALTACFARLFSPYALVSSNNDSRTVNSASRNLTLNPMMLGNVAGLATGFISGGDSGVTITPTVGTANGGIGQKQILTVSTTSGGTKSGFLLSADCIANAVAGHILQAGARIKLVSQTNLKRLGLYWSASGGATAASGWFNLESGTPVAFDWQTQEWLVARTAPFMLSTGSTSLRAGLFYEFDTSGTGAAVIEIEQLELIDTSLAN